MASLSVPRPSLRTRQTSALRAEIAEAALRLFLERGYDETTVEAIAGQVGISARTVFRHYPTKEDIVLAGAFEAAQRLGDSVAATPQDAAPLACVRRAYLELADREDERHGFPLALAHLVARTPRLRSRALEMTLFWEEAIVRGLTDRDPALALRAPLIAAIAVSVARIGIRQWLASEGRRRLADCIEEAFQTLAEIGSAAQA